MKLKWTKMRKQCKNKCEPIVKSISQLKSSKRTHTSCGLDCRHKPHYIEGVLLNEYFGVSNHFERRKTYRVCHNLHLQMKKSDCFKSDSYRNYSYKNAPRRSKRNDSSSQCPCIFTFMTEHLPWIPAQSRYLPWTYNATIVTRRTKQWTFFAGNPRLCRIY